MAINAIISYDDSLNDHDALMFGHVLSELGARLTLAYVRHTTRDRPDHERLDASAADALLARGAAWLESTTAERRIVLSGSTAEGLVWLAGSEQADLVVFGSDTGPPTATCPPAARPSACSSAAPPRSRSRPPATRSRARDIATVGVLPGTADEAAIETAFSIAGRLEAKVVDRAHNVDLLIVGSRRDAAEGQVSISSSAQNAIEDATCPVLVVARGVALHFDTLVTA